MYQMRVYTVMGDDDCWTGPRQVEPLGEPGAREVMLVERLQRHEALATASFYCPVVVQLNGCDPHRDRPIGIRAGGQLVVRPESAAEEANAGRDDAIALEVVNRCPGALRAKPLLDLVDVPDSSRDCR